MADIIKILAPALDGKSPQELDSMRREILEKAKGDYKNLSDEDLHMLVAITGTLRGRNVGPPKKAKGATKATTESLLDAF